MRQFMRPSRKEKIINIIAILVILFFFCKAYYDKHVNGLRHKNTLKALNYQVQVNEIAEKLNNN